MSSRVIGRRVVAVTLMALGAYPSRARSPAGQDAERSAPPR
jgi:hypothetical protein